MSGLLGLSAILQQPQQLIRNAPARLESMPAPPQPPLYEHPYVRAHLGPTYQQALKANNDSEAGFRVDQDGDKVSVVPHPDTNEIKKLTWPLGDSTVAEFHVHPGSHDPRPSDQDKAVGDRRKIDIYTYGRQGMYKYDWQTKTVSKIYDGMDWMKNGAAALDPDDAAKIRQKANDALAQGSP